MPKSSETYPPDALTQANAMRDKALANAMKRKEEYLGARVPKALKERVLLRAAEMEIPVSLLIRRVLEDVFSDDRPILQLSKMFSPKGLSGQLYSGTAMLSSLDEIHDAVIAWQSIKINRPHHCDGCQAALSMGDEAWWGLTVAGEHKSIIICCQCKHKAS